MFDHVKIGVSDYAASKAFFITALEPLGVVAGAEGSPEYGIEFSGESSTSFCLSRMTIRLQRSPSASRVRLIGQPERGAFMHTPKTNCDIKSVDLAYNRLYNAIRIAGMCRIRKGSGYGYNSGRNLLDFRIR